MAASSCCASKTRTARGRPRAPKRRFTRPCAGWDSSGTRVPDKGGPHGPYRQSERLEHYERAVQRLLDEGRAYRCFCSRERLAELRKQQEAAKATYKGYDGHCRELDPEEAAKRVAAGESCTVRLKMPADGKTVCHDGLRGELEFENAREEDGVICKSDGWPTYHLANVVDDHAMGITHVIRGEEWISSLPKHVVLYDAFGWDPPAFFHLGLLKGPGGKKLSKRTNPVSVFHYEIWATCPRRFATSSAPSGFRSPAIASVSRSRR